MTGFKLDMDFQVGFFLLLLYYSIILLAGSSPFRKKSRMSLNITFLDIFHLFYYYTYFFHID